MKFNQVQEWAIGSTPSILTFFEVIALSDLEGKWIRLDAETQRRILGFPVFGKQEIRVADGVVMVKRKVCFGTDYEIGAYSSNKIKLAAESGLKLSPGMSGPTYFSNEE